VLRVQSKREFAANGARARAVRHAHRTWPRGRRAGRRAARLQCRWSMALPAHASRQSESRGVRNVFKVRGGATGDRGTWPPPAPCPSPEDVLLFAAVARFERETCACSRRAGGGGVRVWLVGCVSDVHSLVFSKPQQAPWPPSAPRRPGSSSSVRRAGAPVRHVAVALFRRVHNGQRVRRHGHVWVEMWHTGARRWSWCC